MAAKKAKGVTSKKTENQATKAPRTTPKSKGSATKSGKANGKAMDGAC